MGVHTKKHVNHTVKKGESLWSISRDYYGNGDMWGCILEYNSLSSVTIHPGAVLKVPLPTMDNTEVKTALNNCISAIEKLPEYKELVQLL